MTIKISLPLRIAQTLFSLFLTIKKYLILPVWNALGNTTPDPLEQGNQRALTLGISILVHVLLLIAISSAIILSNSDSKRQFSAPDFGNLDSVSEETEAEKGNEAKDILDQELTMDQAVGEPSPDNSPVLSGEFLTMPSQDISSSFTISPSLSGRTSDSGKSLAGGGGNVNSSSAGGSGKGKTLFGLTLQTRNQGIVVFLDTSGSMEAVSQKVRAQVVELFPDGTIITVPGALFASEKSIQKMKRDRGSSDFYTNYYETMLPRSVIAKTKELFLQSSVTPESIYFLSDYADYVDAQAVRDFGELLISKGIKFFAHSVGKEPDAAIKSLCRATGGEFIKEKVEY